MRGAKPIGAAVLIAAGFELLVSCGSDSHSAFHQLDAGTGGTDSVGGATAGKPSSTGGTSSASGGSGGVSGVPASGGNAGVGAGGKLDSVDAATVADSGTNRDGGVSRDGATPPPDAGGSEDATPPGTPDPTLFGATCNRTSDCGPGLVCITSASNTYGGGMPNGLCTLDCSADLLSPVDTTSVCARISDTAVCTQSSPTRAFCTEACSFGSGVDPSDKCHGRKDMACAQSDVLTGYCIRACRGDFDCGGRICDLGTGACKDSLPANRKLPIGAKCDPAAAPDPCEGICIALDDGTGSSSGVGFCSGYCRFGATPNCGAIPSSNAPPTASCLDQVYDGTDLGDLAVCVELCDCNDDCTSRDLICDPVSGLMNQLGRLGACVLPGLASGDPGGVACK